MVNDHSEKWYGTITIVSADNLASQMIGGYKQLASALRKCRFCMATDEEVQNKVRTTINSLNIYLSLHKNNVHKTNSKFSACACVN